MITIILDVESESADITYYNKLLRDGDSLIVCDDGENIVKKYNEIVAETDEKSDVLLLSDSIKLHDGFFDNMNSCLYAAEKHAIVYGQQIEDNKSLIETAKKYLPEYTITIQANAHCALIKRTVINTLGFLDESYSTLQYALSDYYCRLNVYGFSSVVSHHALFSYISILPEANYSADKELFLSRYEFWEEKEQRYARHGTHPCIEFLELIDKEYYLKKRILFNCLIMPTQHCGTSEYQISVFDAFYRMFKDKYDIFMYVNRLADEYHGLSSKYDNILYPDTLTGTFHLGFAPNQLMLYEPQEVMNKHCLKIIQTMFDIVMVRVDKHLRVDVNSDVELGVKASDGIVFISSCTKRDFLACFSNETSIKDKQLKVIYPATGLSAPVKSDYSVPFEEYFLVVGSSFKHKAIKETIEAVSESKHCFIVIGSEDSGYVSRNIYSYEGGHLDDDFLSFLYANCTAVIFPSMYEGFGLPVAISLKNKKRVIVKDNDISNELLNYFHKFQDYFLFFDRFKQISEIINDIDFSSELAQVEYDDTWDRVATELESFFEQILEKEVDIGRLNERWHLYKLIEAKLTDSNRTVESQKTELTSLHSQFGEYKLRELLRFSLKEYAKNRHPRFFWFLKSRLGLKVNK